MKQISTRYQKVFATAVSLCIALAMNAQDWSNLQSSLGFPDASTEKVELRDQHSKHFAMPNGNTKAFILAGSLHYKNAQGDWTDISTELISSSMPGYSLENTTNNIQSYFPGTATAIQQGVLVKNSVGFLHVAMHPSLDVLNASFDVLNSVSAGVPAQANTGFNTVSYHDIMPGIDNEFEVQHDQIKNGLIVNQLPAGIGAGEHLGYSETLRLPAGWNLVANGQIVNGSVIATAGISIVDAQGSQQLAVPVPDVFEQNNPGINIHPDGNWEVTYKVESLGNDEYRLTTLVPMSWMTDASRQYPVVIDPTVTLSGNWGGWLKPSTVVESNPSGFVYCGYSVDPYHAWTKFDITSVPDASLVIDTKLQASMNATANGGVSETINLTSVTGTMGPYTSYNAGAYTDIGNGVYTSFAALDVGIYGYYDLGPSADGDVQANLTADEFQVGFVNTNIASPPYKRFTSNLNSLEIEYELCTGQITMTAADVVLSNGFNLGCVGDSNGTINTSATGGSGNYSFIFSGPGGYYDTINSPSNLPAGTYFVQVWDDVLTCPDTTTIEITAPDLSLNESLSQYSGFNTSCFGETDGSITNNIAGTGNYVYSWTGPNGFTSTSASLGVLEAGTYNYTVTETTFSCVDSGEINLFQPPVLTAATQLDSNAFCENESNGGVSVVPGGGVGSFTVLWDDVSSSTTLSVSGIPVGTYNVTVTDGNGCTETNSQVVGFESALPAVDLGQDTGICEGSSVILNAGGGFFAYEWNTGETGQIIQVSSLGNYQVTVTNFEGCTNADDIDVVEIFPLAEPNLGPNIATAVAPIVLDPGSYTSYVWSTGASTPTINVALSGTYTVTVTDGNGCKGNDEVKVTIWPAGIPTVDEAGMTLYPNPANTFMTFDASASGKTNLTVKLTNALGQVVYANVLTNADKMTVDVSNLERGAYIFTATADDTVWHRAIVLE